jgi:membrane protein implicated in regulation of membrane protease activity
MTQLFLACAILGGTLLACQFVMSLLGLGGDHGDAGGHDLHLDHGGQDGGHDTVHDHNHTNTAASTWLFSLLTFRSVVTGLTFFGLVGMAATTAGWSGTGTLGAAGIAAMVSMASVTLMMRSIVRLQDQGNVRIENAVGKTGTVYLTVPGNKGGVGKVTLDVQNRSAEYQAVTFQDTLTTGSKVVVVDVVGPETVEVIAAPQYGRMAHA